MQRKMNKTESSTKNKIHNRPSQRRRNGEENWKLREREGRYCVYVAWQTHECFSFRLKFIGEPFRLVFLSPFSAHEHISYKPMQLLSNIWLCKLFVSVWMANKELLLWFWSFLLVLLLIIFVRNELKSSSPILIFYSLARLVFYAFVSYTSYTIMRPMQFLVGRCATL